MKKIKYIVCIVISLNMLFCGSNLVDEEVRWGTILPFTLLCRDNIEEIYDFEHIEGYFGAEKDMRISAYLTCEEDDAVIARLYDVYEVDVGKKLVNEYQERCYLPNGIQRSCLGKEPRFNSDEVKQVSLYRFLWNPKLYAEQKICIQGKFMAYTATTRTKETRCLLCVDH